MSIIINIPMLSFLITILFFSVHIYVCIFGNGYTYTVFQTCLSPTKFSICGFWLATHTCLSTCYSCQVHSQIWTVHHANKIDKIIKQVYVVVLLKTWLHAALPGLIINAYVLDTLYFVQYFGLLCNWNNKVFHNLWTTWNFWNTLLCARC